MQCIECPNTYIPPKLVSKWHWRRHIQILVGIAQLHTLRNWNTSIFCFFGTASCSIYGTLPMYCFCFFSSLVRLLQRYQTIFSRDEDLFSVEMKNRPNCGNEDRKEKSTNPRHCGPGGRTVSLQIFERLDNFKVPLLQIQILKVHLCAYFKRSFFKHVQVFLFTYLNIFVDISNINS